MAEEETDIFIWNKVYFTVSRDRPGFLFFPAERDIQTPVNIFLGFPFVFAIDVERNTGEELHQLVQITITFSVAISYVT